MGVGDGVSVGVGVGVRVQQGGCEDARSPQREDSSLQVPSISSPACKTGVFGINFFHPNQPPSRNVRDCGMPRRGVARYGVVWFGEVRCGPAGGMRSHQVWVGKAENVTNLVKCRRLPSKLVIGGEEA